MTPEAAQKLVDDVNALSQTAFAEKYVPSKHNQPFATASAAYSIKPCRSDDLEPADFNACFNLIRDTSSAAYKNSSRGWHPRAKKEEMREKDMWYLLVRAGEDSVAAFTSFMITIEDDYPVVYVYEIHLSPTLRGQQLGAHLMDIVEGVGREAGMMKAMLTVFTSNEGAERFYRKRGYETDEFSPQERKLRGGKVKRPDYVILSKSLR